VNKPNRKPVISDLTLRLYQPRDVGRLTDMLMAAVPQLPNYCMINPDRERIKYVLDHNIQNAHSFCGWVVCDSHDIPQGCAATWCVMSIVSKDLIADDVFTWVEPEYRSYKAAAMLINAQVEWSKARGARLIRASHTGGSFPKDSREGKLYDALLRKLGFKEVGSIYHYSTYGDR
jgi:GNAT superfamily N-acetyltransferase